MHFSLWLVPIIVAAVVVILDVVGGIQRVVVKREQKKVKTETRAKFHHGWVL